MKKLNVMQMEDLQGGKIDPWRCGGSILLHIGALAGGAMATVASAGVAVVGSICAIGGTGAMVYSNC